MTKRSVYFTFMNGEQPFVFRVEKMTRHPFEERGATMLQVHALLTVEGQKDGSPMDILDTRGKPLGPKDLKECARTGQIPQHWR